MIAKRANVGVGTIYRYFESKDVLINALFLEIKTYFSALFLEADDETLDLKERFKLIWTAVIKQYTEHAVELKFIEQYANSPFLAADTKARQYELDEPFRQLFQDGIQAGLLRDLPIEVPLALTYAVQLAKYHISGALSLIDELLSASFECCWKAIVV